MAIIFPGWSTHGKSIGASTTWHVRCIVSALRSWAVENGELDPKCREMIELLLHDNVRQTPGPIEWRLLAEARSGGSDNLLDTLRSLDSLLHGILMVGVESDAAEALERMADHLEQIMDDEPRNGRVRLRWLCHDMIERLQSETDDRGMGNIDGRIDEAAAQAVLLGFASAPIQRTIYDRDGTNQITPAVGETWPDPMQWISLEHQHPEFKYMCGYRLHDPVRSLPVDILLSAVLEAHDPSKSKSHDPWEDPSCLEARQVTVRFLKRWLSAIDGLPPLEGRDQTTTPKHSRQMSRGENEEHVLRVLRTAIEKCGSDAKSTIVIVEAKLRRADALAGLRILRETGEYTGHLKSEKPRSRR